MLSRTEIERLAQAAHALRPDWAISSLCTWLMADHASRAYRDVAVALVWVACDPKTQTPKRMNELGPWWAAIRAAGSDATDVRYPRCPEPGHTSFPAANCGACRAERLEAPDVAPEPPTDRLTANEIGPRLVRAAMVQHGIPLTERQTSLTERQTGERA